MFIYILMFIEVVKENDLFDFFFRINNYIEKYIIIINRI